MEELQRALEEAQRAGKRQAAPFSRRRPKAHPAKPGRKAGAKYGRRCRRPIPETVDQTLEAELPSCCPHCGGELVETGIENQYQTEIPKPRVERIRFHIHVGRCRRCGRRVQGRHPHQTSDAVGSAAAQLGARAVALATELNKGLGLSYGKTAAVLEKAFGLRVSRGGLAQAFQRVAKKAEPTYQELVQQIRGSPSVTPDETGWKVGGQLWWMWAFCSEHLRSIPFNRVADTSRRWWCWGPTLTGFWCGTDGSFTRVFLGPSIRPAWRICCGAVGKCWKWPGPGRRSCRAP